MAIALSSSSSVNKKKEPKQPLNNLFLLLAPSKCVCVSHVHYFYCRGLQSMHGEFSGKSYVSVNISHGKKVYRESY